MKIAMVSYTPDEALRKGVPNLQAMIDAVQG